MAQTMTILDSACGEIARCALQLGRMILVGIVGFGLVSCMVFPHKYKYYYINYPGDPNAAHEKTSEYTSPPALIRFKYQEIYCTALIQEDEVLFGLEIPEGNTVQLSGRTLKLDLGNGKTFDLDFSQSNRSYAGPALPPNWVFGKDYPINQDGFGLLRGGTVIKSWPLNKNVHFYVSYYYRARFSLGKGAKGAIELPKIEINSKTCEGPKVQFEWREKLGVGSIGP